MTVIAALIHDGRVWMGADDTATDGTGRRWPNARKLVRVPVGSDGHALYASCGNAGLSKLMRSGGVQIEAAPDGTTEEDYDAWADTVAQAVTDMAVEAKPPLLDEGGHVAGQALFAYAGRLWGLLEHGAWRLDRMGGIGSGGDLALGALEVLQGQITAGWVRPEDALRTAVEIACRWDDGSQGPAHVAVA